MSLAGQIALVTGASRGIGAGVARELARRGAHVVATARTQGGLEALDDAIRAEGGTVTLLPLDLRDTASVVQIGPSLFERFKRLDIMVNCAADLGVLTPTPHIMPDHFTDALAVNLTAPLHLIRSCAPLLLAAPAGRAVFLTCQAARQPTAYWGSFGASMAGLDSLVRIWALETTASRLRINLADPGPVATRLRRAAFPGEDQAPLPLPADVAPGIANLCDVTETRHGDVVHIARR